MKRLISKMLSEKPAAAGQRQREATELRRLESLIDTVFAIVIVLMVVDLPEPDPSIDFDLSSFIAFQVDSLLLAMLGVVVVLVYWFQSNLLLGNLKRTDGMHAAISLFQVFLILAYLLSVSIGISIGDEPVVLAMQSIAAALLGLAAAAAWYYASYNRRLLQPEIGDDEVAGLKLRVLAEPLTALLTLPLAFVDALAWELAWLAYPLIAAVLSKTGVGKPTNSVDAASTTGDDN